MIHLIEDLAVLLLVSLPINLLFHKIKLPSVMGYTISRADIGRNGRKADEPQYGETATRHGLIYVPVE